MAYGEITIKLGDPNPASYKSIGFPTPRSVGTCSVGGETVNISVYQSGADLNKTDALRSTIGCKLVKALGLKDQWWVEAGNWDATAKSEAIANQLAKNAGVKVKHVACA